MKTFFDSYGALNIDDFLINQPSFIKIMEDGIVTKEEIQEQTSKVCNLLKNMESQFSDKQIDLIREFLAELVVLVTIQNTEKK